MGRKDKKKDSKTRNDEKRNNKGGRDTRKHKGKNWKADQNDPIRKAVEADGSRTIVDMSADGNCLFRALSDQLYGDYGNKHSEVRTEVCDFMEEHEDDYKVFLILDEDDEDAADFESYIASMREDGEWGGNLELVAAARLYRRNIVVFSDDLAAFTIPCADDEKPFGSDLLLSYHDNDHYNSVRSNVTVSATNISAHSDGKEAKPEEEKNKAVKKGDPCACGSGIKYKKCCFGKEKKEARLQKKSGSKKEYSSDADKSLDQSFRVMAI